MGCDSWISLPRPKWPECVIAACRVVIRRGGKSFVVSMRGIVLGALPSGMPGSCGGCTAGVRGLS